MREAVLGDENRAPTPEELEKMKALVERAMQQGGWAFPRRSIYPPGHYAKTEELIELAKVAARYRGIYATHMRREGQTEWRRFARRCASARSSFAGRNLPFKSQRQFSCGQDH